MGRISPPEVLSIYGIGIVLGTYYGAFSSAISSVFLPMATKMSVENASGEELTDMMIKIGRLSFIILMLILTTFTLFGKQFVYLWVGGELGVDGSFQSWVIALMIMIAYTVPLLQGFGNSILEAKNKVKFKAILYLSFMISGAILGNVLAYKYGAIGMMTGSVIGWIITQNVMNFYYHKKIGLNILRFFRELFNKKTVFVMVLALGIGLIINLIPGIGWFNFIIKGFIYVIVFCLLEYYIGLIAFEKDLIKKTLNSIFKSLKLYK